jgi:hypothetical protein
MIDKRNQVEGTVRSFLTRTKKRNRSIQLDTSLYSEGPWA